MLVYFFPVVGSIIADNWYGKYISIVYLSTIYLAGNVILAVAAGISYQNMPKILSLLGLFLISFGTGGVKPCLVAFGGDQYKLPEQEKGMKKYFSLYYFISSSASLLSTLLTPILAEEIRCFGDDSCYPLAFSVTGFLMFVSVIVFMIGKSSYICKRPVPGENVVFNVITCICSAIKNRFSRSRAQPKPNSFIDYASHEKYPEQFRHEVKLMLKVLIVFLSFPLVWTLHDQKASNWIFLAKKMNRMVFNAYEILPDHMLLLNPLLTVILIPIFEVTIYPLCAKVGILKKPIDRMILGAVFLVLAFVVSSVIFWYMDTYSQLHVSWLVPQYFLLTVSEVLFSVTGIEFSYSEAPESMKSVIQAIWLITTTVGNFIFVIISKANVVKSGVSFQIMKKTWFLKFITVVRFFFQSFSRYPQRL